MGARLSRKKSNGGTATETTGPPVEQKDAGEGSPVTAEQKSFEDELLESTTEETKPVEDAQPDSSTSFLESITQAVEETVNSVTEQIAAPVEDVVNKGITAVESALAAVSLNRKEQEPKQIQESTPEPFGGSGSVPLLSESTLLDDLMKPQEAEVKLESEAVTNQVMEENQDLLEGLDKVATSSGDFLDCKLTYESTIPNSDLPVTLGQEACEAVDLVNY
ncbi:uncharacterized protein [Misgurnus anguillicaudatus]|uniref:uncharacterized protein n=1 Tax=Misgurnus anguillicaudatus TaxID=75329 RepID=UPI002435C973|nr:uncharacterized protein si:dkey-238c7.16 [Misgurnus anguillicaudatus]